MPHVEGVGRHIPGHQVLVLFDPDTLVPCLPRLRLLEDRVDLGTGVIDDPQMVVAGTVNVLALLCHENELARLGIRAEQEPRLTEDRDIDRVPTEEISVELRDLFSIRVELSVRQCEFHVIEATGHGDSPSEFEAITLAPAHALDHSIAALLN